MGFLSTRAIDEMDFLSRERSAGGQCTSPLYACGCIDPATDPQNCGGCGIACAPGVPCSSGVCGSGGAASPPSIDSPPAGMSFDDPSELFPLDLSFTDPNECTPAFCTHLCKNGQCSASFLCTRPQRDHRISGVFRSYLGFLAEPAGETTTFTTGIVPISAPGCPDDLLDKLAEGDDLDIAVGVEVAMEVSIEVTDGSGGSGGGAEFQCSGQAPMCNCSVEACASSDGQCWYETSAGRFDCGASCDCYAAAQAAVQTCCPTP